MDDLTAVVTVADDGGSSGRLRDEFGVLPPGDLRMALAALCGDDEWGQTWAQVLQHRFAGDGDMRGHVVGNLLIVSLWEQLGDHVAALDWVGRLLGASGRVLPMALTPLVMTAQIRGADPSAPDDVTTVRGQVEVATSAGTIQSVALDPPDPAPCAEAVLAVQSADWVVLGPGSWYTSVIPHLLVPDLCRAVVGDPAARSWSSSTSPRRTARPRASSRPTTWPRCSSTPLTCGCTRCWPTSAASRTGSPSRPPSRPPGARLVVADIAAADGSARHDPGKLAAAYDGVLAGREGD